MKSIHLPHGEVTFPAFFPDGTYGVVRTLDAGDLENCQVQGLVMNAYHLLTKPGVATVKALGGLNSFTGWHRPILTDSGGFQVFSLIRENPKYGEIRKNEIIFRPGHGKDKIVLTPEKCIQSQFAYGADVMMCLDYCTHPNDPQEINQYSVEITLQWAQRCKIEYERILRSKKTAYENRPLLFGIIQGGDDRALRKQCAEGLLEIGFDGFGFGGWPLDQGGHLLEDILHYTASLMPDSKPKYAMGLGKPEGIVACHRMGYNLFDCVIPTREARHNRLYVFTRDNLSDIDITAPDLYAYHYIMDDKYMKDARPVSACCDCYCCRHYSRAYLRHLYKIGDTLAYRLATIHNVRFYTQLMELLRKNDMLRL